MNSEHGSPAGVNSPAERSPSAGAVAKADAASAGRPPLALWGGLECTVVRIGDEFRDQSRETGHRERLSDLAAIAALGVRTVRYPVLWETVSPDDPDTCDWSWHDERLHALRDLGISVIAGLVHHGSGPAYTSLLDPDFPRKLAVHARRVAERYPWIEMVTPVNEPLTTARFSGLYGHWYPHDSSYGSFLQALVNQIRGVQDAMKAFREVVPAARLVQTEDLGKTFSTPPLAYQAEHENERRWLGFDLLCGRVQPGHTFWQILLDHGIAVADLEALSSDPCPPDIIGINHYLTSERYLDHRLELYPGFAAGGNGQQAYADVEAVRVPLPDADRGPAARMREAWERYHLPLAVTEVHLGCTRDEQLRWLRQVWDAATLVRGEGVDMRAVTIWSLFGAVDWNSLLTRRTGFYEPGAFDVRGPRPRRTALARAAAELVSHGTFDHPTLDGPAWWDRPERFYSAVPGRREPAPAREARRRLLIVGDGRLGRAVAEACEERGLPVVVMGRTLLDPADPDAVRRAAEKVRPWAIVNCCGFSGSLPAEREPDRCFRDNVIAAAVLAEVAAEHGAGYAVLSTDQVFDGAREGAYVESDRSNPVGLFGRTKEQAELDVMHRHPGSLILRTGPLFGAGRPDMLSQAIGQATRTLGARGGRDLVLTPTYIPDFVHGMLDLLVDGAEGLWHLTNFGEIDAAELLERAGLPPLGHRSAEKASVGGRSRVHNLALGSKRGIILPSLGSALDRYAQRAFRSAAE
jgi:dTDP-4-dehydrorhamnose reductase